MDQTRNGYNESADISVKQEILTAIFLFVQRVEADTLVIWENGARKWDELFPHGVIESIMPIHSRQNVRCESDRHWSELDSRYSIVDEVCLTAYILEKRIGGRA